MTVLNMSPSLQLSLDTRQLVTEALILRILWCHWTTEGDRLLDPQVSKKATGFIQKERKKVRSLLDSNLDGSAVCANHLVVIGWFWLGGWCFGVWVTD